MCVPLYDETLSVDNLQKQLYFLRKVNTPYPLGKQLWALKRLLTERLIHRAINRIEYFRCTTFTLFTKCAVLIIKRSKLECITDKKKT